MNRIYPAVEELCKQVSSKLVKQYNLASENLTEQQIADIIRQMLLSGDFIMHVCGNKQAMVYVPYRKVCELETEIKELKERLKIYEMDFTIPSTINSSNSNSL